MSRTAYVDADMLIYLSAFETQEHWGEDQVLCDPVRALRIFHNTAEKWTKSLDIDNVVLCLSDRTKNFRKDIDPQYKANRKDLAKPVGFDEIVASVYALPNVLSYPTLEADDVIGIHTSSAWEEAVAISKDKDFFTVPCAFYQPGKMQRPLPISEDQANLNWLRQALTGDVIDNYKGIPKIGEKKAQAILPNKAPVAVLWQRVVEAYQRAGLTEDDALRNARLARILRKEDFNESSGAILWTPPAHNNKSGTGHGARLSPVPKGVCPASGPHVPPR